ncbi:MAG TPA: glycosyltransferase [Gammaproteobacteria bacterium]|nr:glycosyltransferase [Gammaproteobacteria bacterium]
MSGTLLSINNYYYARGGAEVLFMQHNGMLAEAGWSVVPFCMQHADNYPTPWSYEFVEEIELDGEHDGFAAKLRKGVKAVYSLEARAKVRGLLDRVAPDVCHAHNVYHHLSPSILAVIHGRGIPLVMTLHDLKLACPAYSMLARDGVCERCRDGRLFNVFTQRCMKNSGLLSFLVMVESYLHRFLRSYVGNVDRFLVPSRFYLEKFVDWGFDRARFRHLPNFVDAQRYEPRFTPGRRFAYVGRLSAEKGIATLIEAAALAGVPLDIIGTGRAERSLRDLAGQRSCDVRFHGYLAGRALHAAMAGARAIVVPSEWYENAPLTVLEAGALGKPVIASAIGGLPELVVEGETGWTFAPGSVEALAERLRAVADLADTGVERAGRAARRHVAEEFGPDRYLDGIRGVYLELGVT